MLLTGATASVRGSPGFAAFSGALAAKRALAQSMARELSPKVLHHRVHGLPENGKPSDWSWVCRLDPECGIRLTRPTILRVPCWPETVLCERATVVLTASTAGSWGWR